MTATLAARIGRAATVPNSIARQVRAHPKIAAGVAVLVVLLTIGGIAGAHDTKPVATGARPADTAPTIVATSPTTSTSPAPVSTTRSGTAPPPAPSSSPITAAPADAAQASSTGALQLLATVEVKGRAPKTGYSRAAFGQAWTDDSGAPLSHGGGTPANEGVARGGGCDTRNDILRRDLVDVVFKPGSHDCAVASGTLHDPYTGRTIAFVRGTDTSSAVQIDHVVALSDAWQKGAQYWPAAKRVTFANDPLNLLAVDGPANMQKGDGDAATWLPPNRAYRCAYVARQVAVKARYGLWVTQAEHDAIARILDGCPGQSAPSGAATAAPPPPRTTQPAPPPPATTQLPAPQPPAGGDVYYKNCTEAREAGAAPILRGQPGYRAGLDRDNDGVACE
jgi:hypothetical protein